MLSCKYIAGYTIPKQAFLGLRADKKFTDFSTRFLYAINPDVQVLGCATLPKSGTGLLTFGATYRCNPNTALKFKAGTTGDLAASAKQTIDANTNVIAAAGFNIKDPDSFKFGITASLS